MTTHQNRIMKLLKTALPSILTMAFLIPGIASCEEYDMTEVNAKVKAITDKKLHVMEASYEPERLLDSPEFQALRAKCTADWQQIAANIETVQGGDEAGKLVIYAFENLTPQNYMTALEALVSKYESGGIGEAIVRSIYRPEGKMGAFAIDNYNHPRMAAVLNRIKSKTTTAAVKADIGAILNGSAKSQLDDYRDNLAGTPEGNIPKVILPP